MTLVDSPTFGSERVAREAVIVLLETLNDTIPDLDSEWAPLDEELATLRGVDYVPIELEPLETENFYLGHRPSLIEADVDKYPNVSVMADRVGASSGNDVDQATDYDISLWVEVMVKSLDSEEEVNARVQRLADAANRCMMSNRTLRGVVSEISDVFVRKEKTAYGKKWFWQGARLQYTVEKQAAMPSGDFLRPAGMASADFDQS
jgi:hypothetical protein